MLRWIVRSSLQIRFLVIVIAAALIAFGITELRKMPVDVFPEFNPPQVEVQTEALGLSAEEVESLITVPMEADLLNGVAWLDQIYSESVAGLSSILLVFEPGTDPIRARQMVQERLTQAFALPNVSKPPVMLQPLSTTSRVMMVGLSSDELSLIEMGVLARWNIVPRLMGVPGVANVAIWGQRERQLQVLVDPVRLQAQGVSLEQVIETTGEALWVSPLSYLESSTPGTAGWIDTPNQRLTIQHLLPISTAEDLAQVAVVGEQGVLLNQVARVLEDHQPLIGDAILNAGPGLLLVVEKFPSANTLEVTRGVEDALDAMRPGLTGVEMDTSIFRPANYIRQASANLSSALLVAALLIALVLAAFFFDWRTVVIGVIAIPLALIAAVFVLYLRGATFNMMVLAGLVVALGIVIDDAVIVADNIARRLRQHREDVGLRSHFNVVLDAVLEMHSATGFATLIILVAALPIFFIQGLTGAFLQPLVVTYVLAVLASLVVAGTVTPALSLILFSESSPTRRQSPILQGLQRGYNRILLSAVRTPYTVLAIVGIVALAGLAVLPFFGLSLEPSLRQTDLLIEWRAAPGTSRPEMARITANVANELRGIPGVRNVGTHVGRAVTGDAVVGINSGELWVSIDSSANYDATLAAIDDVIGGYPGVFRQVRTYQPERTGEALLGPQRDVVVRIYGHELDVLRNKAREVERVVSGISGVSDTRADIQADEPQVEIRVDLAAAERYGLKPGDVRRQATTLLSGLQVGTLFEEQKVFEVVVWGVPEIRDSLTDIEELLISAPGGPVRLGDVAEIAIAPTPTVIKRDAVSRYIDVSANVRGRSVDAVTAEINSALNGLEFPLEYHAEVLGGTLERQSSQQRLIAILVAAFIGVLLLLQAAFSSWRLAFVVMLTLLPVVLAGSLLAAFATSGILTLGSLFGFLAVLGVAVRNSMTTIYHYRQLEEHEGEVFGEDLALRGSSERLAPILMTAFTTALALTPLIVAGNVAGNEILYPLAIVILGGLVTSTLLNLFVLPALYLRFGASPAPQPESLPLSGQPGGIGLSSD